jgi:hypothetical protein
MNQNTYTVRCVFKDIVLGYVAMESTLAATIDRREHDDAVHDIMLVKAASPQEERRIWRDDFVTLIETIEAFDLYMEGGKA